MKNIESNGGESKFEWLKEMDSPALANAQMNLQKAFTNFFANLESGFRKRRWEYVTSTS